MLCDAMLQCIYIGKPVLTFAEAQASTTQNVGSNLAIPVQVSGLPIPEVCWSFSNGSLDDSYVTGDATSTNLTIRSLAPQQLGVYTVTAVNVAGQTTAEFTVNLLGK